LFVVFVFAAPFCFPVWGVWLFFASFDWLFGSDCFKRWFLFGEFDSGSGRTLAACLTHASRTVRPFRGYTSGERVSNTWVICPALWDKPGKLGLIPNTPCWSHGLVGESFCGVGWARGLSACWWGDGLPRRRRVAGLRGCPATLGLRYGPDSYGRQQWGILHNGRKPDAATPREG
jgi:hypothetical protein